MELRQCAFSSNRVAKHVAADLVVHLNRHVDDRAAMLVPVTNNSLRLPGRLMLPDSVGTDPAISTLQFGNATHVMGGVSDQPPARSSRTGASACTHVPSGAGSRAVRGAKRWKQMRFVTNITRSRK